MGVVGSAVKKRKNKKLIGDLLVSTRAGIPDPKILKAELDQLQLPKSTWKRFRYQGQSEIKTESDGTTTQVTFKVDFTHKTKPGKVDLITSYVINIRKSSGNLLITTPSIQLTQGNDFPDSKHYVKVRDGIVNHIKKVDSAARVVSAK